MRALAAASWLPALRVRYSRRYYRVQMGSSSCWSPAALRTFASLYLPPLWPGLLGVVYLIGRQLYCSAYVADPAKREFGFTLSMLPIVALLLIGIVGSIEAHAARP